MTSKKKATSEVFTRCPDGSLVLAINAIPKAEYSKLTKEYSECKTALSEAYWIMRHLRFGQTLPKGKDYDKIGVNLRKAIRLLTGKSDSLKKLTKKEITLS